MVPQGALEVTSLIWAPHLTWDTSKVPHRGDLHTLDIQDINNQVKDQVTVDLEEHMALVHMVQDLAAQVVQVDLQVGIREVIKVDLVVTLIQVGMDPAWSQRLDLHREVHQAALLDLRDMDHLVLRAMDPLVQVV